MSLFGSLMADVEDDPFFGSHMRQMRQLNSFMMNSMFSDPFGILGGGPLAIGGPAHGSSMMPCMPQMPNMNRLFSGLEGGHGMGGASSYSSSTVFMSSGPNGKPQVISSSSSTKIGPNGLKETRNTLQDSRTGTKKMSIGHHIGERAHVIEREQNVYTGDAEVNQEFINLEEDEAEDFDKEFQMKAGVLPGRVAITAGRRDHSRREPPRLALPAPPSPTEFDRDHDACNCVEISGVNKTHKSCTNSDIVRRHPRPTPRRPIRTSASPLATSSNTVRETYSAPHPQRRKHRVPRNDN